MYIYIYVHATLSLRPSLPLRGWGFWWDSVSASPTHLNVALLSFVLEEQLSWFSEGIVPYVAVDLVCPVGEGEFSIFLTPPSWTTLHLFSYYWSLIVLYIFWIQVLYQKCDLPIQLTLEQHGVRGTNPPHSWKSACNFTVGPLYPWFCIFGFHQLWIA